MYALILVQAVQPRIRLQLSTLVSLEVARRAKLWSRLHVLETSLHQLAAPCGCALLPLRASEAPAPSVAPLWGTEAAHVQAQLGQQLQQQHQQQQQQQQQQRGAGQPGQMALPPSMYGGPGSLQGEQRAVLSFTEGSKVACSLG